jgi:hypothetical protein
MILNTGRTMMILPDSHGHLGAMPWWAACGMAIVIVSALVMVSVMLLDVFGCKLKWMQHIDRIIMGSFLIAMLALLGVGGIGTTLELLK